MTTEVSAPWVPSIDTFSARLALVRHTKGWNRKEAAIACGLPYTTWRSWETDGVVPKNIVVVARQISLVTGCDFHWLLLGPSEEKVGVTETEPRSAQRVVATVSAKGTEADPNGLTFEDVRIPRPRGPVRRTRPIMNGPQRPAPAEAA